MLTNLNKTDYDLTSDINKLSAMAKEQKEPAMQARFLRLVVLARAVQGKDKPFLDEIEHLDNAISAVIEMKKDENSSLLAWLLGTKLLAAIHINNTPLVESTKKAVSEYLKKVKTDDHFSTWALGYQYLACFVGKTSKEERKQIRERLLNATKVLIAEHETAKKLEESKANRTTENKEAAPSTLPAKLSNALWACITGILAAAHASNIAVEKDESEINAILIHELQNHMKHLTGKATASMAAGMAMLPGLALGYLQFAAVKIGDKTLLVEANAEGSKVINQQFGKSDFISFLDVTLGKLYTKLAASHQENLLENNSKVMPQHY